MGLCFRSINAHTFIISLTKQKLKVWSKIWVIILKLLN